MMKFAFTLLTIAAVFATQADDHLFSDDFNRAELGDAWKSSIPAFKIVDGTLKGWQAREDHGAVGGFKLTNPDGVLEFRFRLEGSKGFNAVWDDKGFKGSHAGHICRVVVAPTVLRFGDDKEGVMRNDIFEMRRDPARKADADKLLVGRNASFPHKFEQDRWYQMRIELIGDELSASVDGKFIGKLKSSGIGHPTKNDFHFTVSGKGARFDDVKLSAAK
ncbi:MAG: hypothetical protein HC841_04980 [Verrucomicrobiae bacterium]|nr:hypothetical protein [Verrucomicrobiae bacterium]